MALSQSRPLTIRFKSGKRSNVEPSRGSSSMNWSTKGPKRSKFAMCAISKVGFMSVRLVFHWGPSVTNMPLPKKLFPPSYLMGCRPKFSKFVDSTALDTSGSHVRIMTLPLRLVLYVLPCSQKRLVAVSRRLWFCADSRLMRSRSILGYGGSLAPCFQLITQRVIHLCTFAKIRYTNISNIAITTDTGNQSSI